MATKREYFNQTTWRTVAALEALAERDGSASLTEVAEALDCSKSSLFPIMKTLERAGYVRAGANSGYSLTARMLVISQAMPGRRRLASVFAELSHRVVSRANESLSLGVLDREFVVCIGSRYTSRDVVRLGIDVGQALPVHATALGKCLLAGLDNEQIHERFGARQFIALTGKTLTSLERLIEDVERTRTTGFAEEWQELSEGLASIAAPIRNVTGATIGAICFSVPIFRATPDKWVKLREAITSAATEASLQMGHRP